MITGRLKGTTAEFVKSAHPIWRRSFQWVEEHAATSPEGIYELGTAGWFVNLHSYRTIPVPDCRWENHERTVDLQYMLKGREIIRWQDLTAMGPSMGTWPERDTTHYVPPIASMGTLQLEANHFAIFYPGEAHCPKIQANEPTDLLKLVVKIPASLLNE